jgi:hypothetical protein
VRAAGRNPAAGVAFASPLPRVDNARFDRHFRKIHLGLRLLSHRARAHVASDWSGLTLDQLVTLRRRWMPDVKGGPRGPAPTSYRPFFGSALKARQAALFAGIHRMVGFTSSVPSLEGGEKLCEAYEIYREWEPDAHLEFDYGVLLATGVLKAEEVELVRCQRCGCAHLIDKWGRVQRNCARCRSRP